MTTCELCSLLRVHATAEMDVYMNVGMAEWHWNWKERFLVDVNDCMDATENGDFDLLRQVLVPFQTPLSLGGKLPSFGSSRSHPPPTVTFFHVLDFHVFTESAAGVSYWKLMHLKS